MRLFPRKSSGTQISLGRLCMQCIFVFCNIFWDNERPEMKLQDLSKKAKHRVSEWGVFPFEVCAGNF